jgi:GT2 family glycosyltransferase
MDIQTSPVVSVIVPIHSGAAAFVTCLANLLQAVSEPHEIIIVADGPAPQLAHLARQCGIKVVQLAETGGPARARNQGATAARGDILFFVDSDVAVPPDIIPRVTAEFRQNPQLAALVGSYDDRPAAPNFLSQYRNLLHHYTHQNSNTTINTFWAGCGAVRRSIFLAAGGFDESYRQPSIEDIELGYRLTTAGHTIRLLKSLQVTHLKRWDAANILYTDFWQRALPWTRLLLRQQRFDNNLNIDKINRTSVVLNYLFVLVLVMAVIRPALLGLAALIGALLLWANRGFYNYIWQARSAAFALAVIPWHWLYYLYSGLAFVLGCAQHYYNLINEHVSPVRPPRLQPIKNKLYIGDDRTQ